MAEEHISFGPFLCDPQNARVWREGQAMSLPPKAFDVLLYLLRHPGRLVSKEELLKAVWSEAYVGDAVLKVSVGEIRKVLADDPKTPRFIETVHRRGYRFIAPISTSPRLPGSGVRERGSVREPPHEVARLPDQALSMPFPIPRTPSPVLVGRAAELGRLQELLDKALRGERQVVFVTGEPGIGKTALVETFLSGIEQQATGHRPQAKIGAGLSSPQAPSVRTLYSGLRTPDFPIPDARSLMPGPWIARGQCLEHYGAGEAYLPVLEAFGRLCRESGRERLVELLERYAPIWLTQMPALVNPTDRERLQREILGATSERMLREMAEAMEALTAETPLVLVLEDLHWSDYATLDLVAALTRRREPARLLVIGTYRPVDVIVSGHPLKGLKQELQGHSQCEEISLDSLTPSEVALYLAAQFPESALAEELAQAVHRRTDGNPLFLINFIEYLVAQGVLRRQGERWVLRGGLRQLEEGMPESIRQMIERQIERLSREEQRILEAASVAGMEFAAATVEAVLEEPKGRVEECCDRLARQQQFLRVGELKTWPDSTVTASYRFTHSLYQTVLLQRVAVARRLRFHQRIGERLEVGYGAQTEGIAAELAVHFEQGRAYQRAIHYLQQAAEQAARLRAPREAIEALTRALALAEREPETERAPLRMSILAQRGLLRRSMGDTQGAAQDFTDLALHARELGQREWEVRALLYVATTLAWIDHERCLATAEQAVALSRQLADGELHVHARAYYGYWRSLMHGWRSEDAHLCAEAVNLARQAGDRVLLGLHIGRHLYFQCIQAKYQAVCRAAEEESQAAVRASDAHSYATCQLFRAWALLHRGQWGEMTEVLEDGEQMAERDQHPAWKMAFRLEKARLHAQAGDWARARELSEQGLVQAREIEHQYGELSGYILLGWIHLGMEEDERAFHYFNNVSNHLRRVLLDWILQMPLYLGLSEYWLRQGEFTRAREEAERLCEIAAQPGERTYLALGRRMLAEIALAERKWGEAETAIARALAVLENGEAPLAEWRVCATAARVKEQQRRKKEARQYWERSRSVLLRLADSLDRDDPLCRTFLTQPLVREIIGRG